MNPTALQILTAFARPVAALPCHWADPGINSVNRVSDCIRSGGQPQCVACRARAALEAAVKAPGLADDQRAITAVAADFATGTGCRICANRNDGKPCAPCRAYAMIALRAVDAYQRGGAKP